MITNRVTVKQFISILQKLKKQGHADSIILLDGIETFEIIINEDNIWLNTDSESWENDDND